MNHTRAGTGVSSPEAEIMQISLVLSGCVAEVQHVKGEKSVDSYSHE